MWKSLSGTKLVSRFVGISKEIELGKVKQFPKVKNALIAKGDIKPVLNNTALKHFSTSFKSSFNGKTGLHTYTNNCRNVNIKFGKRELFDPQIRCLHTSPKRNALPPVVVVVLGRLAKMGAVLFGRIVRRWWQKLPAEEKALFAGKVRRNRYIVAGLYKFLAFVEILSFK